MIIPTLYALNELEFLTKLEKINFSKNIHLDFMDSIFTTQKSVPFKTYEKILNYTKKNYFEVHIMGTDPTKYLEKIIKYNIKKVLIHIEILNSLGEGENIINTFKQHNIEVFLVINPKTRITKLYPYLENKIISGVMFMSVNPGKEGQKFINTIPNKIIRLKKKFPKTIIQIDGGINETILKKLKTKNIPIDLYSVGSFISSSQNPKKNYNILNSI